MEVNGTISIAQIKGVTKLHFRSETEESYIEVNGQNLRETNPTIDAYRAFVVGLAQSLMEERAKLYTKLKEMERNGTNRS